MTILNLLSELVNGIKQIIYWFFTTPITELLTIALMLFITVLFVAIPYGVHEKISAKHGKFVTFITVSIVSAASFWAWIYSVAFLGAR